MDQQEYQQQLKQIKNELDTQPGNPDLLNELGILYQLKGDHEQAVATFQEALQQGDRDHRLHYNMANSYYQTGLMEQAMHYYLNAIDIKPDHVPSLNNLADIYEVAGEHEKAIELYEHIAEIAPENPISHLNLGNAYARTQQGQNAVRSYQKVLELDKQHLEAHFNIGLILKHNGHEDKAREYFETCLKLNPTYQPARQALQR
ncbi:MAG: tetratricopeptide repeat protein [Bacteroidota bacterium]